MPWTGDEFSGGSLDPQWEWVNQGGATASVANGQLNITAPSSGVENLRILKQDYTGNLIVTAVVSGLSEGFSDYQGWGIVVGDSSTGRYLLFQWAVSAGAGGPLLVCNRYSSPTAFNAAQLTSRLADMGGYLQIEDDGTDLIFRVARFQSQGDGGALTFQEVYREARATYLTGGPDQIGYSLNAFNADAVLLSRWVRTGTPVEDEEVVLP